MKGDFSSVVELYQKFKIKGTWCTSIFHPSSMHGFVYIYIYILMFDKSSKPERRK